jgi:hypothetical protein
MPKERQVQEPITVVSGLPRSGTSMMMQMLAAGGMPVLTDNLRRPDEDNPRGYYELEAVKNLKQDTAWLARAGGHAVKMVYRLLYDLPRDRQYQVVFLRRNLNEVLASQTEMLSRLGKDSGEVDDETLRRLYERQLIDVQGWLSSQAHFRVLYVEYQDVLSDPEAVVRAVDDFLGGGLDTDAMLQVPDRSLYRQRL